VKPEYDDALSNFAFRFNYSRYTTVVSSTEVRCAAPTAAQASLTSNDGPVISGAAEIELSFNGYPSDPALDALGLFNGSLWTKVGRCRLTHQTCVESAWN
jgi:hypothetical protein